MKRYQTVLLGKQDGPAALCTFPSRNDEPAAVRVEIVVWFGAVSHVTF